MLKLDNLNLDGLTMADWICFCKQDSGLQELREWMGDESLLRFVGSFSGIYLKVPTSREIIRVAMDFELAEAVRNYRASKKAGDLQGLVAAEQKIAKISSKLSRSIKWGFDRGKMILRDMKKAKGWIHEIKTWRQRHGI